MGDIDAAVMTRARARASKACLVTRKTNYLSNDIELKVLPGEIGEKIQNSIDELVDLHEAQ